MELINNRELVIEIKNALTEKGIGQSDLEKMLKENGHPLAKTTIQRLFKEGSEDDDSFSYKSTLKPIAEIVLDKKDDLNVKIDALADLVMKLYELASDDMSFMRKQVDLKDNRMERKDAWIQELREENKRLNEEVIKLLEKCRNCERK